MSGAGSLAQAEGDAEAGAKVYRKCKACHVVDGPKHRVGPSLQDLMGRTAGTAEGYKYSKAMIAYGEAGTAWGPETLFAYLEAPRKVVPGTKMSFCWPEGAGGPGKRDRLPRDLLALSDLATVENSTEGGVRVKGGPRPLLFPPYQGSLTGRGFRAHRAWLVVFG